MALDRSELSSIAETVDQLVRRVATMGDDASARRDPVASDLYEVERALTGAGRRIGRLLDPERR